MLDAVLPLVAADLPRFRILERSIRLYLDIAPVCWVVVPDRQWLELARAIRDPRFMVVPESRIVPELADAPAIKGWYKQQMIKLAMAEHVGTEHYLLFDADVICARPVTRGDLIQNGRALCHRYRHRHHAEWYSWSERLLYVRRSGWVHGVTPTVLSRDGVRSLAAYLNQLPLRPKRWWQRLTLPIQKVLGDLPAKLVPPKDEDGFASSRWREVLLASLPWTEYGLYFTYLEATGQFERFHVHSSRSLCGPSIWKRSGFEHWNPQAQALKERPFLVVQSIARIPPELVMQRVEQLFAA